MPIGPRYRSVVGRRLGITSDSELEVDGTPITGGSGISEVAEDTDPELGGDLDLSTFKINGTGRFAPSVVTLTDGATPALNAALGHTFYLDAAGDRTIAVPSNAVAGQKIVILHYANTSARTLSLNTGAGGFRFNADITALTETSAGKTDFIGCIYNGADSKWDVVAYIKGAG